MWFADFFEKGYATKVQGFADDNMVWEEITCFYHCILCFLILKFSQRCEMVFSIEVFEGLFCDCIFSV